MKQTKKVDVLSEKREKLGKRKNDGAILKFVNVSSDAILPSEMHKVSSATTSKSIPEVKEEICLAKLEIMKKQMLTAI